MISGLDMLGDVERLGDTLVLVRIKNIDPAKLKKAVGAEGGIKGALTSAALATTNRIPKAVLDVGLPVASNMLRDKYGIDASITAADAYRPEARRSSEFWPGLVAGTVFGASILGIWRGASRLLGRG
jgi:hypothetical protein